LFFAIFREGTAAFFAFNPNLREIVMDFGKGLTNGMTHEKGTVLIIDDDLNQNISIRGALERQRYKVHSVTNYREGRRMITEALPDVMVNQRQ
jgi:PleD family two-component response regulator